MSKTLLPSYWRGSNVRTPHFLRAVWTWVSSYFDGVPPDVADHEWLVRYVKLKDIKRDGTIRRGAFTPSQYPAEFSVDRERYCDTRVLAQSSEKGRAFLLTSTARAVPSHPVADKWPRAHAMLLLLEFARRSDRRPHKRNFTSEEWARVSKFFDSLIGIARSTND